MEQVVLWLGDGGARAKLHVDNVFFGSARISEYRVGPDGAFYQLQTSRELGVRIVRYEIDAPPPSSTPTGVPSSSATVPSRRTPAAPSAPTPPDRTALWLVWTGGVLFVISITGIGVLVWRHRRPDR
jgi:hypothetical protein